jgi:hypothetical protein
MRTPLIFVIVSALLLAFTGQCLSQIGETKDELIRRYGACQPNPAGKPRGPNVYDSVLDVGEDCTFQHDRLFITAFFKRGKTHILVYRKHPSPPGTIFFRNALPTSDFQITDPEISSLLQSAVPSAQWIVVSKDTPIRQWRTSDSSAFAYYFASGHHDLYSLQIQTAAVDAMYKKVDKYIRGLRPN